MGARAVPPEARDQRRRGRRRHGADRHGVAAGPRCAGLHAGHRTPAARDVRPVRGGAGAIRHRRRVRVPGHGGGCLARESGGSEPDVSRRRSAARVLRRAQGRAAAAQARHARRVDRRPSPRAVGIAAQHREGRARPRPQRHREAEPARGLDARRGLGLLRTHEVPYHELFDHGYASIGCAPCIRPVEPGEPERAGRWWWEHDTAKECGIHCSVELAGSRSDREKADATVEGGS